MKRKIFKKGFSHLEKAAFDYINKNFYPIDLRYKKSKGRPDFLDINKKRYEIKRIRVSYHKKYSNIKSVMFTESQIRLFRDDDNVLIFKPFSKKPELIVKFSKIKNLINKSGYLNLDKLNIFYQKGHNPEKNKKTQLKSSAEKSSEKSAQLPLRQNPERTNLSTVPGRTADTGGKNLYVN